MKNSNVRKAQYLYVLVALCGVLCAVSFWVGHVAALVCLFGASVGMAEALVLSFILRSSFDAKLLYLMLFFSGTWAADVCFRYGKSRRVFVFWCFVIRHGAGFPVCPLYEQLLPARCRRAAE